MPEHGLHVGEGQGRVFSHPVGRGVTQRVQRDAGARGCPLAGPLEHPVDRVIGQRPGRAARGPPQRLPLPAGDQPGHLHLIQPQPHERIGGGRQLLQRTGALADHGDQLPARLDATQGRRQQLRGPRPGRHVERHQRPVPMRRQRREDLVELTVRDAARDPGGNPRPVPARPLMAVGLHRVAVRVRPPAPAATRSSGNGLMTGPLPACRWKS